MITSLFALAIFGMLSIAVLSAMASTTKGMRIYRDKTVLSALADKYLEIGRNLPYSKVGTLNGNPSGLLPDQANALAITYDKVAYQIYYEVTYVDDPADGLITLGTDPAPNDYKQVKLDIKNVQSGVVTPFITTMVPKGLESLSNGGALVLQVIDAVGQPVPGASVHITNTTLNPDIDLTRTTDSSGNWVEVGLPDAVTSYHVVVTKNGYSSDQTYPSTGGNPNPTKPDATVSNGVVTQISFAIDKTSSLALSTVNAQCAGISNVGIQLQGAKIIGTPSVIKYDNTFTTDGSGLISLNPLEWDNYTPAVTSGGYMIYGSSPIQQISVLPNTSQVSTLILGATTANSLLVIVKDAATGNPIENASVQLERVSAGYDVTKYTEGSTWNQMDWSGGAGQANFSNVARYDTDDGNVDIATIPTGLRLASSSGAYYPTGVLTSSSFDTGSSSTSYTMMTWKPTSQNASTTLKFQIATNNDNATWNYIGPDGTAGSYFTTPGTAINAANNNNRYVKYKAFLSTIDPIYTPVLSSLDTNYVAGCAAPGQAMFAGLTAAANYTLTISMAGYLTQTLTNVNISGYNTTQIQLSQ